MCVSLHVRVFIPNSVCLQTAISLPAEEGATKSKPYCAAVCRTAIPLKTWAGTLSHTHSGRRGFSIGPSRHPSAALPTRHTEFCRVLAVPIRAVFMTLHLLLPLACTNTFIFYFYFFQMFPVITPFSMTSAKIETRVAKVETLAASFCFPVIRMI